MTGIVNWNDRSFHKAKMRPMAEPSWEALIALPDGTEVLVLFVLPLGVGLKGLQFEMTPENRTSVERMRDDKYTELPSYATYVLPDIEIPEPEAFLAADNNPRKDADK